MKLELNVEGADKIIKKIQAMEKAAVGRAYDKAIQDVGEKIGEVTESGVPVDKGQLKQAFVVTKVGGEWVVGYNTQYAAYQHQGRRKNGSRIVRNRPGGGRTYFLTLAIQENSTALLNFFKERFYYYLTKEL